ncbi:hypothetical protein K450DRAFT_240592 [Umbelopsis ramanniana AG]|uniref:methylated diphthine methylhydrolase n=1 Tax=Umbelopsis ramanniana AG TaxID=1314678 RepID=A0AAD5HD66_UMBRA|nr:uncharacterized protein K450DRAFT_240592 [Umbelopsis ramanniana AG]KAI8579842.1 hypothetical protein K450DRAFT_240592 [Umbelopsis ramanniana AG]
MVQAKSLFSLDTEYSADSTEFCPFQNKSNYLACGTYQLYNDQEQNDQAAESDKAMQRKGRLYLYKLEKDDQSVRLQQQQALETPAILDMKWCHQLIENNQVLGVADSVGGLSLYGYDDNDSPQFEKLHSIQTTDPSVLCLSLDWSTRIRDRTSKTQIVTSHSSGEITLFDVNSTSDVTIVEQWQAHDLEAWIAAFNYWQTEVIYTGADDCLFKGWDMRMGVSQPTFTSKKHDMGVTAIQSSPHTEHILATGSYDERLRIWDTRSMRAPLTEIETGGGIWRIKWHPTKKDTLLSASMHAGGFVVNVKGGLIDNSEDKIQCEVTTEFLDHTSMTYGGDWVYNHDDDLIATCSFYDHVLHLWNA